MLIIKWKYSKNKLIGKEKEFLKKVMAKIIDAHQL